MGVMIVWPQKGLSQVSSLQISRPKIKKPSRGVEKTKKSALDPLVGITTFISPILVKTFTIIHRQHSIDILFLSTENQSNEINGGLVLQLAPVWDALAFTYFVNEICHFNMRQMNSSAKGTYISGNYLNIWTC